MFENPKHVLPEQAQIQLRSSLVGINALAENLIGAICKIDISLGIEKTLEKRISFTKEILDRAHKKIELQNHPITEIQFSSTSEVNLTADNSEQKKAAKILEKLKLLSTLNQDNIKICSQIASLEISNVKEFKSGLKNLCDAVDSFLNENYSVDLSGVFENLNDLSSGFSDVKAMLSGSNPISLQRAFDFAKSVMIIVSRIEKECGFEIIKNYSFQNSDISIAYQALFGWRAGLPISRLSPDLYIDPIADTNRTQAMNLLYENGLMTSSDVVDNNSWFEDEEGSRNAFQGFTARIIGNDTNPTVATLIYHQVGNVYGINELFVDPSVRGQGIGAQIMNEFLSHIVGSNGQARIYMDVPFNGIEGYSSNKMTRFLMSFGFNPRDGAEGEFTRFEWERYPFSCHYIAEN